MLKKQVSVLLVLLLLVVISIQASQKQALVIRLSNLKAKASFSAPTVKKVGLGHQVLVMKKQGGWLLVQGVKDKSRGWLRSYQVRSNISPQTLQLAQKKSSNSNPLANLSRDAAALLGTSKKRESKGVVATIGVRGLSEQELKEAKPNPKEFNKMKSYVSNKKLAAQFAAQGKLQGRK